MKLTDRRIPESEIPPEFQGLLRFLGPFNKFVTTIRDALTNRLTFKDNFLCEQKTVEVVTGQTYPIRVQTGFIAKPTAISIRNVEGEALSAAPWVNWMFQVDREGAGGVLFLTFVGLSTARAWKVLVRVDGAEI